MAKTAIRLTVKRKSFLLTEQDVEYTALDVSDLAGPTMTNALSGAWPIYSKLGSWTAQPREDYLSWI